MENHPQSINIKDYHGNHPQSINIKDYHGKSSPIHKSKGLSWKSSLIHKLKGLSWKSFPIHKLKRLSWIPLLFFFINKANPYGYPLSFLDILEFVKDTSPPLLIKFKCYSLRIPLPQRQKRTNKSLELELTPTAFDPPPSIANTIYQIDPANIVRYPPNRLC